MKSKVWYIFEDTSLRKYDDIPLPPIKRDWLYLKALKSSLGKNDELVKSVYDNFVLIISDAMRGEAASLACSGRSSFSPALLDFIQAAQDIGDQLDTLGDVDRAVIKEEDHRQLKRDKDYGYYEISDLDLLEITNELVRRTQDFWLRSSTRHPGPPTSKIITAAGDKLLKCWLSAIASAGGMTSALSTALLFFDAAYSLMIEEEATSAVERGYFRAIAYAHSKARKFGTAPDPCCRLNVRSYRPGFRSALRKAGKNNKLPAKALYETDT